MRVSGEWSLEGGEDRVLKGCKSKILPSRNCVASVITWETLVS